MDKGSAKERLIIKLVCVLLSFCLWIYVTNVETIVKTYTLKDVPVQIVNTDVLKDSGLALAPGQQFNVNLNLEGPSKYIYAVNKNDFTINADLSEYALKKGENNIPVQIINYPQQINIKNNGYLIVKVKLEALETKTFKAVSQVTFNFAPDVYEDAVNYTPENIEVSGPSSAVNQVAKVALVGSLEGISESVTKTFKYEPLNTNGQIVKDVQLSKTTGTLGVTTNTGIQVPITAQLKGNLPNGMNLVSTQLSQNYVTIIGNKQVLSGVKSLNTAPIDLSQITGNTTQTVKILLPEGVTISNGNSNVDVSINVSKPKEDTNTSTDTENSGNNSNNNSSNDNNSNNNNNNNETVNKTLTIPLTNTGLQNGLKIDNIPNSLSIQISGTQDIMKEISTSDFTAVVDLSEHKESGTFSLTPKVTTDKNVKIDNIPSVSVVLSKAEVASAENKKKQ
ncbi:CdaR family protein [uncultured Clostridium sp.]|uniref:CdaR family protein n=1 Tax=uncultured Clostridium sp. TaxID=59620 RepID=UPI00262CA854|nr:CdaR family protein [uncultured Clostridium sp.]